MARDLHADMKIAKNLIASDKAWIVLFEISVSDIEIFRLTNNEEAVTFNSLVYSPFPIMMETMEESGQGDLPYINVTVSNVERVLNNYMEQRNGLLDQKVKMQLVNEANLINDAASITINLVIRETTVTENAITFRLSHHPFFEIDMPHQRFYRGRCRWAFKSTQCGWTGLATDSDTCDKTLDGANGCQAHGDTTTADGGTASHPARFGGFPGIPRRRI
ncbi:MAG: hypothetical protein ABGY10_01955 [bacterium]